MTSDEQLYAIAVTHIQSRYIKSIGSMLYDVTVQAPSDEKPVVIAKFNAKEDAEVYADVLRERHLDRGHGVK